MALLMNSSEISPQDIWRARPNRITTTQISLGDTTIGLPHRRFYARIHALALPFASRYFSGELMPNRITGIRQHLGRWRAAPPLSSSIVVVVALPDSARPSAGLCHVKEPPWTLMCLLRLPLWLNLSRHSLHWYGFSPEWIRRCLVSVELSENAFLQNRHLQAIRRY